MGSFKAEDGRFRSEAIIVRNVDGLRIVFWDADSIYVYYGRKKGVIFHKWSNHEKRYYTDCWKDFRRRLLQRKHLSLLLIHEMAAEYDVVATHTLRELDLSKEKVEYRS